MALPDQFCPDGTTVVLRNRVVAFDEKIGQPGAGHSELVEIGLEDFAAEGQVSFRAPLPRTRSRVARHLQEAISRADLDAFSTPRMTTRLWSFLPSVDRPRGVTRSGRRSFRSSHSRPRW